MEHSLDKNIKICSNKVHALTNGPAQEGDVVLYGIFNKNLCLIETPLIICLYNHQGYKTKTTTLQPHLSKWSSN